MRELLTALMGLVALYAIDRAAPLLEAQQPPARQPARAQRDFPGPDGPPRLPRFLAPFDTNRDGELSEEEIENSGAILRRLDRNRDGLITDDELGPPPGRGFPGGRGPGGPMRQERKLVKEFDTDNNGRLNLAERTTARKSLGDQPGGRGPGRRGFGPPGRRGRGQNRPPASPGPELAPGDVPPITDALLYDRGVLRTLFLEFESEDWEAELADFKDSDVEVPAVVTVDGNRYAGVGVHFRGMSSFRNISAGHKRSLNLSFDFVDPSQRIYGYKTLNLLNCMGDPSMMSTVLYSHLASPHLPVPKANFARVVINGRSWGIYANVQQFNKEFLAEQYRTRDGARWKVNGSPRADGGLRYLGENVADYRERFEIKSSDRPESWQALIALCRTLEKTPVAELEKALEPILNVDGLLWFLAFDVGLVNNDGYWTRASDYSIYLDPSGKFHILPHDMNEVLRGGRGPRGGRSNRPGGFPGRGGPGGFPGPGGGHGGVDLEPLVGIDNPRMPLRSKVLAVPALRRRYLEHLRTIATTSLDWNALGPVVAGCRRLIEKHVRADTRKLDSFEAFQAATSGEPPREGQQAGPSLRSFVEQRRRFLLEHDDLSRLPRR